MHTEKPQDFLRLPLDGLWKRVSPPSRLACIPYNPEYREAARRAAQDPPGGTAEDSSPC